jgi:hypothetical protein
MIYHKSNRYTVDAVSKPFKPVQTGIIVHEQEIQSAQKPSRLRKIWYWLTNCFENPSEPCISQWCDRSGNRWWHAHNPTTGESAWLNSVDEIRVWLDQPSGSRASFPQKPWWS